MDGKSLLVLLLLSSILFYEKIGRMKYGSFSRNVVTEEIWMVDLSKPRMKILGIISQTQTPTQPLYVLNYPIHLN